ncbi:hypothetical protein ACOMHN_047649 [Nucella lapillus]
MTTPSKPAGWRRLTKTHAAFETIPSFRVSGKDLHSGNSSTRKPPTPKKPAQYADPMLFPGRRLDRRQQSSYSGFSGHRGISGLEQLTLNSSGRFRTAGSTAGSTKLSHASLPSLNRHFLPDGSDPWGSARQINREDSPLTMLRRQVAEAEEESKLNLVAAHPPQSSISKVSRWQQSNFVQTNRLATFETREPLLESPDSMESHESELEPPVDHQLLHQRELRRQEQRERERQQQDLKNQRRGKLTPPPPGLTAPTLPTQQSRGLRHLNPHCRPAETHTVSPTPPSGSGLKLNKILWALAPDEHANTSDAAISHKHPSCRGTSATEDKVHTGRYVPLTDMDAGSDKSCRVSDTSPNLKLTQKLLSNHDESASLTRDDRIFQWLSECDQETTSSLPTHLPDIKYTFKYLKSAW